MDLILPAANAYAMEYSSMTNDLLKEIETYTYAHHPEAHMLSGPVQGMFLSLLSKMIRPKRILEIGSFVGYSALCLAEGLQADGILHTIELREKDAAKAKEFIKKSPFCQQIILHQGSALDVIKTLDEEWDLVFVDADKTGYADYYNTLIEKSKSGAWFIFDNVLFHGEVLKQNISGKSAKAIAAFNEQIQQDERIEKVMLTVRDGISIIRKK